MHQTTKGAITPTTPVSESQSIERHQLAFNALSVASWHLARGNTDAALARIRRATTHIKQACTEANTSGVSA